VLRRPLESTLFVYTYILMQHMIGGIRHLIWDFGYGMEPGTRMNMARATPIAAAILTVLIWAVAFLTR
jgi:succinate dehydrogenase / fumarate reductase, cytochrome b subunit